MVSWGVHGIFSMQHGWDLKTHSRFAFVESGSAAALLFPFAASMAARTLFDSHFRHGACTDGWLI